MKMVVIGAGAWGTALAVAASRERPGRAPGSTLQVALWARDGAQAGAMRSHRVNARYLPGVVLPAALDISDAPADRLLAMGQASDLVVIATPMAGLRPMLETLAECTVPIAWLCKGFELPHSDLNAQGLMPHEVARQVAPSIAGGALSGPSFAQEVALGQPTALVAASADPAVRDALVRAFHGPALRVYANDDIVGVEVGGAVKNVLAIATGLCDGLQLGLNARAALITRGLAEMTRFGVVLGARPETFMGLSGLGDLVLTATGDLSRNRKIGLLLAQGKNLQQSVESLGHVAEGVYSARTVLERARALQINMPITEAVVALLDGLVTPAEAVLRLMGRDPAVESG
ncbi:MAG: NAD(P)H-dependent glycerol-3-phosphate dehydrogenase [Burkholderiales bacterium]